MKIQHIKIYRIWIKVLIGKFIALNAFIRKEEKYKISDLRFYLKKLEEEQSNLKVSRGKKGSDKGKCRNL